MFEKVRGNVQYFLDDRPFIVQLRDVVDNCRCVKTVLSQPRLKPLKDWIDKSVPALSDPVYRLDTKIYWIFNGINDWTDSHVICPVCGKPFIGKNVIRLCLGYSKRCSVACMNSDPCHVKQVIDAQQDHLAENPNFWKDRNEKTKQTKIESGHEWNWVNSEKIRETKRLNHGDPNWNNIDKARDTRYRKNNGEWHSADFPEKTQATTFKNHGYRCPFASDGIRHTFDIKAIREKARQTMKRNGTCRTSKAEDNSYALLCEYFGANDVDRSHKTKEYPFNCDFYIKSFDLYIELNGTWTHGFHAFDENSDSDVKRLRFLEEKVKSTGSKYYKSAIYVWTDLDPRKRGTAAENRLNFLEFWTFDELAEWLDSNFLKDPDMKFGIDPGFLES